MIFDLPLHLLSDQLKPFLLPKEWKSFLLTCRMLHRELYVMALSRQYSIQFYQDETFRKSIMEKIKEPSKFLSLNLSFVPFMINPLPELQSLYSLNLTRGRLPSFEAFSSLYITKLNLSRSLQLVELPQFPNVRYLNVTGSLKLERIPHDMGHLRQIELAGCLKLSDACLPSIRNVPIIDLQACINLKDVNCLYNAKQLTLNECTNIADASKLGNVKILDLTGCSKLRDASGLTNNEELSLARCPLVTDISSLSKTKKLNLSESDQLITDFASFLKDHTVILNLSLRSSLVDEHLAGFQCQWSEGSQNFITNYQLQEINLSNCQQLTTIHNFAAVKRINIANCFKITQLPQINAWKRLNMSYNQLITDFSMLTHLRELQCVSCMQITDEILPYFQKIRVLNLQGCNNIRNVSCLAQVYDLNLSRCSNIYDVSALGNVHTLSLQECSQLTDVSGLTNNYSLNLSYCKHISTDLTPLQNIAELNLAYCTQITDVSCLHRVKILFLHGNPQITDLSMLTNVQLFK